MPPIGEYRIKTPRVVSNPTIAPNLLTNQNQIEMATLVFQYNNGSQIVVTAPKKTTLDFAMNVARENMPEGATCFRHVTKNGIRSVWMR